MRPPKAPPPQGKLPDVIAAMRQHVVETVHATLPDGRYLHWDELRHRAPPEPIPTVEQWWAVIAARGTGRRCPPAAETCSSHLVVSCRRTLPALFDGRAQRQHSERTSTSQAPPAQRS